MADKKNLYVSKPGGVIVHLSDGSQEHLQYGDIVDVDNLAEYQHEHLAPFTDDKPRDVSAASLEQQNTLKQANANAARADQGQVNSTSDPVPGNYAELDEDEAVALVNSLDPFPSIQARIGLHEAVNYGRQKVIDALSDVAKAELDDLQAHYEQDVAAQSARAVAAKPKIGKGAHAPKAGAPTQIASDVAHTPGAPRSPEDRVGEVPERPAEEQTPPPASES